VRGAEGVVSAALARTKAGLEPEAEPELEKEPEWAGFILNGVLLAGQPISLSFSCWIMSRSLVKLRTMSSSAISRRIGKGKLRTLVALSAYCRLCRV